MLDQARALAALRRTHPVFRRRHFLTAEDIEWRRPDGREMTQRDWLEPERAVLAFRLSAREDDDSFVVLMNAERDPLSFALPPGPFRLVLDTADKTAAGAEVRGAHAVAGGALVVLVSFSPPSVRS